MLIDYDSLIKKIFLKNNIAVPKNYNLFSGGQINQVYNIDDIYVLKFEGEIDDTKGIFNHQQKITDELLYLGVKVPKIFDIGEVDNIGYMLMEKVKGNNLINDWLNLSNVQKETLIEEITHQAKLIHSIKYEDYSIRTYKGQNFENYKDAIASSVHFEKIDKTKLKKQYREDVEHLEEFYKNNIDTLDETDTSVLVHNDFYYGNMFHENGSLTGIIDFDWSCKASKDYELWKFVDFVHRTEAYVEERLEKDYLKYDASFDLNLFKKYYPELFSHKNLHNRIRLYYLNNLIMFYTETQSGRWSESTFDEAHHSVNEYYRSDWLEKLLML